MLVPPIVVTELFGHFAKNEQLEHFRQVYGVMKEQPQFQFLDLSVEDVREFMELNAVPELHDRIITGHAHQLDVPLVTNDPKIIDSDYVNTIW